ncbi:hypothetical protein HaLaN_33150 [Haematococcus lacustris]|uniref:Uncharacterized protein n=1 Tax=Haematococcus lacustris TaxID=44745 RepID=A0A6A0ALF3_HAELA|nr:hypothetical protein HaLaN_33150 [Haematococcus lacustris]
MSPESVQPHVDVLWTYDICTDASLDICTALDTVDICTAKHPSTSAQLPTQSTSAQMHPSTSAQMPSTAKEAKESRKNPDCPAQLALAGRSGQEQPTKPSPKG